ncbi:hypothetical protein ACIU1J_31270 [Azospirillum doebereinerae]|uniref:hypothetical protein n=1 Tax=Azospirillum doebereinerae TaxID=92933 RepID=UPI001EE508F3|nr:hypothetical protein [Azospirillum doebereinerae]MCG5239452.1 hypothetical protein [Azospirillum doebereinerae]
MNRCSKAKASGGLVAAASALCPAVLAFVPFARVNIDFITTPAKNPKIGGLSQSLIDRKETHRTQRGNMCRNVSCDPGLFPSFDNWRRKIL